ncbi:MAG: elongation factor P [Bacilli bacterium]|nr:elongation factor P [Bacilli bacterium]MBR3209851.1 elongation factor P [Bacilli bacterium]
MININDIKNGMTVIIEGNIYLILEFMHVKPGKGPAFVRIKLKNLRTGSTIEKTFNTNIKFEKAIVEKKPMQYLYGSGDTYNFMNMETYEQIDLDKSSLGDDVKFLKEGLNIEVTFYKGEVLGINLPEKIEYEIAHTEPGVKGNTATNATKDATLENGLTIKVPLFINENDHVIVSTKDGKYDSRA